MEKDHYCDGCEECQTANYSRGYCAAIEDAAKLMETHVVDWSKSNERYDALPMMPFKHDWATPAMKARAAAIRSLTQANKENPDASKRDSR